MMQLGYKFVQNGARAEVKFGYTGILKTLMGSATSTYE